MVYSDDPNDTVFYDDNVGHELFERDRTIPLASTTKVRTEQKGRRHPSSKTFLVLYKTPACMDFIFRYAGE